MFYNFPIITDIEQVRAAISGREEFVEVDKGEYIVFNYLVNFADTFPPVWEDVKFPLDGWKKLSNTNNAILRECRGLIFDKMTGKVIARRYHKFFNYGEKPETLEFDFNMKYRILEKLDGSMITPFMTSDGVIRIGTKMGETQVAEPATLFMSSKPNYMMFITSMVFNDCTPIFEWCTRKQRIVIDYPEDRMVLTAIRDNESGQYASYEDMKKLALKYSIDYVDEYFIDFNRAKNSLEILEDMEGYVVRFDNGHMLKLKGEWYLQLHKTLEHLQHEKDVIRLIIDEKLDDAKPLLAPDIAQKIDDFGHKLFHNINQKANDVYWSFIEAKDRAGASKKDFALLVKDKKESSVYFKLYDMNLIEEINIVNVIDLIKELVYNSCNSQTKVDATRHWFGGIKWEN